MKRILIPLAAISVGACSSSPVLEPEMETATLCIGSSVLPKPIRDQFKALDDPDLLNKALGAPNRGKLCQAQVYESKVGIKLTLYRAWNSTNPNSRFGNWWAFEKPAGKISTHRAEYQICYQWTPLDKLETCMLKPGTKLVVGTGQSIKCSEFLSYSVSDTLQIFIDDAKNSLINCSSFDGEFNWK